jgi:hypothetical protein
MPLRFHAAESIGRRQEINEGPAAFRCVASVKIAAVMVM